MRTKQKMKLEDLRTMILDYKNVYNHVVSESRDGRFVYIPKNAFNGFVRQRMPRVKSCTVTRHMTTPKITDGSWSQGVPVKKGSTWKPRFIKKYFHGMSKPPTQCYKVKKHFLGLGSTPKAVDKSGNPLRPYESKTTIRRSKKTVPAKSRKDSTLDNLAKMAFTGNTLLDHLDIIPEKHFVEINEAVSATATALKTAIMAGAKEVIADIFSTIANRIESAKDPIGEASAILEILEPSSECNHKQPSDDEFDM